VKTLAILTRRQDAEPGAFQRLAKREIEAVFQGMATGVVRAVHGLVDGPGAALELETDTPQQAAAYIDALPFVMEDLLIVQLVPLKPFPAFAQLA